MICVFFFFFSLFIQVFTILYNIIVLLLPLETSYVCDAVIERIETRTEHNNRCCTHCNTVGHQFSQRVQRQYEHSYFLFSLYFYFWMHFVLFYCMQAYIIMVATYILWGVFFFLSFSLSKHAIDFAIRISCERSKIKEKHKPVQWMYQQQQYNLILMYEKNSTRSCKNQRN